jgi:carbon-monoxide dehydrogenase large subunit
VTIFSGDFSGTMDLAIARSEFDQFAQRKAAAMANGRLRGIGIGYYIESSGGGPQEEAQVTLNEDGSADVVVGTFSHGQGHRTTYSQIISETLGIDFDKINIIQGDTEYVKFGGGTGGSRSSQMGGVAVRQASQAVAAGGLEIAAQLLQAPAERVVFDAGTYRVADSAAEVSLGDVARAAFDEQFGASALSEVYRYDRGSGYTFPNGCHVAEVEVDPDTGEIEVVAYTAVDDCGRVINPLLARGQVHGGVVQGLGQTLLEAVHYNEDGQLITGSFMDYCMPRASQTPDIDVSFNEVLEPNNELGVKGIGEGGACGAPPALVNAVRDALKDHGICELDMPLTSEKIWRALASYAR